MFHLSFAQKLAVTMTSLVLLASLLIGYPMVYRQFSMMEEQFETIGQGLAKQAAENAVELIFADDKFGIPRLVKSFETQENVLSVVLVNRDFEVFGTELPRPVASTLTDPQHFNESGLINDSTNISWFHAPIQFNNVTGGSAWIGMDKSPLTHNQNLAITTALTALALLLLAIIWLTIRLSRNLTKPIQELICATKAINKGHYDYRINGRLKGEFSAVQDAFNTMVEGLEEKLTLEKNISRFVSSPVANHYMSRQESELTLQGERVEASIMFVDLVNYTRFSEAHTPEVVADVLNFYFAEISQVCHRFYGNVDKFIGDCAMLVFGCPSSDAKHREHALECAIFIRNRIHALNADRRINQLPWLDIRIGLAQGHVVAGLLGSPERLNYSVIGAPANLAARLCDKAPCGEILTDRGFLQALGDRPDLRTHETQKLEVKGFSQPIDTMVIEDIGAPIGVLS